MAEIVRPRYGVIPETNDNPDLTPRPVNTAQEVAAKWRLGWAPQTWARIQAGQHEPDPDFNPWSGLEGYERYAADLVAARSKGEQDEIKALIDRNLRDQDIAARGEWGLISDLLVGAADPVNLVPIPAVKGIGFFRAALKSGAAIGGLTVGTEMMRQVSDPTAEPGEMIANIGIATLLGGALGGVAGAWGRSGRAAARRFEKSISDVDMANPMLEVRFADEGIELAMGERPAKNADGTRPRISITDELGSYQLKELDGVNYAFEDGAGWVYASDLERDVRRQVPDEDVARLGEPERSEKRVGRVDQAGLTRDFNGDEWRGELAEYLPDGVKLDDAVRTEKDYIAFRTLEHLWRERLPRKANETDVDFQKRVGKAAMEEALAGRTGAGYAKAAGFEWILERMNLSPVAKAMRVFKGDNVVADTALRIGGDYGWAVRANEFGFRTPPSLLLKGMRHTARWVQFRHEFDQQWLKYASGEQEAVGKMFQNMNLSATAWALRNGARRLTGQNVLTYDEFSQMVGRAVYTSGDFVVNGHHVNQYAREAAKAYTRMMEEYDRLFREHGLFADQKGLQRQLNRARREELYHKSRVAEWLWGKTGQPSKLTPAISIGGAADEFVPYSDYPDRMSLDELNEFQAGMAVAKWGDTIFEAETHADAVRELLARFPEAEQLIDADLLAYTGFIRKGKQPRIFTGETHEDAIAAMIDELGDEGVDISETLAPEQYGYVYGQPAENQAAKDLQAVEYIPDFAGFKTTGEALRYIIANGGEENAAIAKKILKDVEEVPFKVIDRDQVDMADSLDVSVLANLGTYNAGPHRIVIRGLGFPDGSSGANVETVLHEAIHGATSRRLRRGIHDSSAGKDTPYAKVADELADFWYDFKAYLDDAEVEVANGGPGLSGMFQGLEQADISQLEFLLGYAKDDIHEMSTVGLTNPAVRYILSQIPDKNAPKGNMLQRFWELIRRLLGFTPKERTQFDRLVSILDNFTRTTQRNDESFYDALYNNPRASREAGGFIDQDTLIEQREASLSPRQREIYAERKQAWEDAKAFVTETEARLAEVTERPHQFLDAAGLPEPYYSRYFDKSEIATNRAAFTRLVERWYERDNPTGARARAEETVDKILTGEDGSAAGMGSMRALNRRALNIPNSWTVEDPELGTIAMADFIDNNVLATSETYIRRGGMRLEAAKAFGDADLRMEFARTRQHLAERYLEGVDENDAEAVAAAREKIGEAMGWLDITAKSVMGVLKTGDPWTWSNRSARLAMDITNLSVMGKVGLTAIAEIGRAPMVAGIGAAFRAIFMRHLDELGRMKKNSDFAKLTGELNEMAMTRANVRVAEMNAGENTTGGTWFERQVQGAIPGFFKMTGLTSWTMWAKEWTMLAAQHSVMSEARRIAEAVAAGGKASPADELRLAALGINARDALLLARMPVDIKDGGRLIMPDVESWTGVDGRRAREALLTAIHAEARRAIVTPGVADKSTVFSGVWSSKGQVLAENDLMRLPVQFMGYGVAAHNKLLTSALQGRDRSRLAGMLFLMLGGLTSIYLKTPDAAWRNKEYDELLLEAYEASGIGGFWFGDLNNQIEQFTGGLGYSVGVRPALGMDPKFGKQGMEGPVDFAGAAPSHFWDVSRAFWDSSLTATQRAQMIRRGIPYNNMLWWAGISRNMASTAGGAFEGAN